MERSEVKSGRLLVKDLLVFICATLCVFYSCISNFQREEVYNENVYTEIEQNEMDEKAETQAPIVKSSVQSTAEHKVEKENDKEGETNKSTYNPKYAYNYSFIAADKFDSNEFKVFKAHRNGMISDEQYNEFMQIYNAVWDAVYMDKMPDVQLIEYNDISEELLDSEYECVVVQNVVACKEGFADGIKYYFMDSVMSVALSNGQVPDEEWEEYKKKREETFDNLNPESIRELMELGSNILNKSFE